MKRTTTVNDQLAKDNKAVVAVSGGAVKLPSGRKLWTAAKIFLYAVMWLTVWSCIAFGLAIALMIAVVFGLMSPDGVLTSRQANNVVLVIILIIGAAFLGTVWLLRNAKKLSYRVSRVVLLVCTIIGLLIGVPASLLGVWEPEHKGEAVNSTATANEQESVKRYQFMVCSDFSYRHYTDEQMKQPGVGFVKGGDDNCATNDQGKMLQLVETQGEVDAMRQAAQTAAQANQPPVSQSWTSHQPQSPQPKTTCRNQPIFHGYTNHGSDAMYTGESKITQEGVDGERRICWDGDGREIKNEVVKQSVDEVYVYGTAVRPREGSSYSNPHSCGYYASIGMAHSTYSAGCRP